MSQTKNISSECTTLLSVVGGDVSIVTTYQGSITAILSAFISQIQQIIESVSLREGDLGVIFSDNSGNVDLQLNSDGELIVIASDSENYHIDSEGYLIYEG